MPLLITGTALLLCDRFCTCEVKDALMSILKPVYSTPGVLLVSKTLMPRWSMARRYWIVAGRPFFQASRIACFSASALASASAFAAASALAAASASASVVGFVSAVAAAVVLAVSVLAGSAGREAAAGCAIASRALRPAATGSVRVMV